MQFERSSKKSNSVFLSGFKEKEFLIASENKTEVLGATLTYPKKGKNLATIILISGSGAQGRDAYLFGKPMFKTMAEHFTRSGYAVLRFDDRGVNKST